MRPRLWFAPMAILVAVACGSGDAGGNPLQPPPGPAVVADTVIIIDNSFGPASVKVTNGGTVTWTWSAMNTQQHNVRWGTLPAGATLPNSPTQATGSPFEVTFTIVGAYPFVCNLHSGMEGTVFVE